MEDRERKTHKKEKINMKRHIKWLSVLITKL
jgi:hypothetical protein